MVANSCLLKEIDIQTCTKDDIPFESPFQLTIKRNDYVQVNNNDIFYIEKPSLHELPHGFLPPILF